MSRRRCQVCKANLPPQASRWQCAECLEALARMAAAHAGDDDCRAAPHPEREARIARYAAVVAAGGRIFEESPGQPPG